MLSNDTIKTIETQLHKVSKVIKISNGDSTIIHLGRKKAISVTLNSLDLFDVSFLIPCGKCYNQDKSKQSVKNVDLYGFSVFN